MCLECHRKVLQDMFLKLSQPVEDLAVSQEQDSWIIIIILVGDAWSPVGKCNNG